MNSIFLSSSHATPSFVGITHLSSQEELDEKRSQLSKLVQLELKRVEKAIKSLRAKQLSGLDYYEEKILRENIDLRNTLFPFGYYPKFTEVSVTVPSPKSKQINELVEKQLPPVFPGVEHGFVHIEIPNLPLFNPSFEVLEECPLGEVLEDGRCFEPLFDSIEGYDKTVEEYEESVVKLTKLLNKYRKVPPPVQEIRVERSEKEEFVFRILSEVQRTGSCPSDFVDINILEKLAQSLRNTTPTKLEMKALIAHPDPNLMSRPSNIPMACGYNSYHESWFGEVSFYCTSINTCFMQSNGRKPIGCSEYSRIAKNKFQLEGFDCDGDAGLNSKGVIRTMWLIPLGRGIFIEQYSTDKLYYTGIIISPNVMKVKIPPAYRVVEPISKAKKKKIRKRISSDQTRLDKVREYVIELKYSRTPFSLEEVERLEGMIGQINDGIAVWTQRVRR